MDECSQLKPMLSKWTLKDRSNFLGVLAILGSIFMDALCVVSQKQLFSLNLGIKTRVTSCLFNSSISNVKYLTSILRQTERFKRLEWLAPLFTYWKSSVSIWSTCDKSYFIFSCIALYTRVFHAFLKGCRFFLSNTQLFFSPQPVVKINETRGPTQLWL